jgi:betaine-aldehyde dehydrogenase
LTADKISGKSIDTTKVTIEGANGKLKLKNNRLQVFDNQTVPVERVSLGDVNGDGTVYGLRVRGADGTTILMDETGVKPEGITDGAITNDKIANDADIDGAVEWAMIGIFFNQGEVCSAGSRIIIEKSIKDEFVKRLKKKAEAMTIGLGINNPDMGPIITEQDMEKVLNYIKSGIEEGATLVCGGKRHTQGECANGYFVEPTIFDNCTRDMKIVREEIFGPVVTIQTFETEEQAIAMANDTEYGLAGAVFTSDLTRAHRVIAEIRAGITWINCYNPTFNEAPWGGYKMSGIGRELGIHGLEEYQEVKQININLTPGVVGWYEN